MVTNGEITKGISTLYDTINQIIEEARAAVYRTANITMVRAYWHIGRVIVEDEQKGKRKGGIWQTGSQTIIPKTD